MQTQPTGWQVAYAGSLYPVAPSDWWMFASAAQRDQVLAALKSAFPDITFSFQSGAQQFGGYFFMPPPNNPAGIDVWVITAQIPGKNPGDPPLQMQEYAGDLWDRGPAANGFGGAPNGEDKNTSHDPLGGPDITYTAETAYQYVFFRWSLTAAPVYE